MLCVSGNKAIAQRLAYNKGFELTREGESIWVLSPNDTTYIGYASDYMHSGKYSLVMDGFHSTIRSSDDNAPYFYLNLPLKLIKGKEIVTLKAWVKTLEHATYATIWLQQSVNNNESKPIIKAFADTISNIKEWQLLTITTKLDKAVSSFSFGGLLNGGGKTFFDDFTILIDGKEIMDIARPVLPPTANEINWLNRHLVPLTSIEPTNLNKDLDSLSKWIGNSKVVGVGEPTHGTREASLFKFRLFKYLAENKGFNTFMLEDELPECGIINRYVLDGSDTALKLIKNLLFKINRTEEMLQLIEWMRSYNLNHAAKIQFRGMDMQSIRVAFPELSKYTPFLVPKMETLLQNAIKLSDSLEQTVNLEQRNRLKEQCRIIMSVLKSNIESDNAFTKKLPIDSLNWFKQNLEIVNQYFGSITPIYRDSCMAKNVLDYTFMHPMEKLFIWAHNSHVSTERNYAGWWLQKTLGNSYYPVAIATSQGSYTASEDFAKTAFHSYPLKNAFVGSAEYFLATAAIPNYILSLSADSLNKNAAWLKQDLYFRNIGFLKEEKNQFFRKPLANNYQALTFIKITTHTNSFLLKK